MDTAQEHLHFPRETLHEITKNRSEKGLQHRLVAELEATEWDDKHQDSVRLALGIALEAHREDRRGNHPYSTHILRVAIRVMSPDHFNIRDDPDLITAALLHDIVEDHPEYFADQDIEDETQRRVVAIKTIEEIFGENVATMVGELSNPILPEKIADLEDTDKSAYITKKNAWYQDHVKELLETDSKARIIKLSHFVDNGVGLIHNEKPKKAVKLAHKYCPLIPHYRDYIENSPDFSGYAFTHLEKQMDKAEQRCHNIIKHVDPEETNPRLLSELDETHNDSSEFLTPNH